MEQLTVIIPFLNEGKEIYNTLQSIRATAGDAVKIMLVNDASTDEYEYESVAREFKADYLVHEYRKGVAASRDEAIGLCTTPYFMLLDGHMRFYQDDWVAILLEELKKDERVVLCCNTIPLELDDSNNVIPTKSYSPAYGAYIDFRQDNYLKAAWNIDDPDSESQVVDIACVLGAAYACSKAYWLYLRGLQGLCAYGYDEQLISIKVWLEGGKCRLLKNIGVGHLYRKTMPYKTANSDVLYNSLYLAELFLPYEVKHEIFKEVETLYPEEFKQLIKRLVEQNKSIQKQKEYYRAIFCKDIVWLMDYNEQVQQRQIAK